MRNPFAWVKGGLGAGAAAACAGARRFMVRLHLRLRKSIASPRAVIASFGAIVACITIAAPPATYAWLSASQLHQRAL